MARPEIAERGSETVRRAAENEDAPVALLGFRSQAWDEIGARDRVARRYNEALRDVATVRELMKGGAGAKVFWAGPSIGFDLGANASKVFVLVYKLPNVQAIFKRYPGVDGSLYYVGGVGVNYQRLDGVTLAPMKIEPGTIGAEPQLQVVLAPRRGGIHLAVGDAPSRGHPVRLARPDARDVAEAVAMLDFAIEEIGDGGEQIGRAHV